MRRAGGRRELDQVNAELQQLCRGRAPSAGGRQVATVGVKGQSGKTTAVTVLGTLLAPQLAGVTIGADLNPDKGTLVARAGAHRHPTTRRLVDLAGAAAEVRYPDELNMYLDAVGRFHLLHNEQVYPEAIAEISGEQYAQVLKVLRHFAALTLIDTGTSLIHPGMTAALSAADHLVIAVKASPESLNLTAEGVEDLRRQGFARAGRIGHGGHHRRRPQDRRPRLRAGGAVLLPAGRPCRGDRLRPGSRVHRRDRLAAPADRHQPGLRPVRPRGRPTVVRAAPAPHSGPGYAGRAGMGTAPAGARTGPRPSTPFRPWPAQRRPRTMSPQPNWRSPDEETSHQGRQPVRRSAPIRRSRPTAADRTGMVSPGGRESPGDAGVGAAAAVPPPSKGRPAGAGTGSCLPDAAADPGTVRAEPRDAAAGRAAPGTGGDRAGRSGDIRGATSAAGRSTAAGAAARGRPAGGCPSWGGRPVPMPQHVGHVRVDARAPVAVTAAATLTALPGFRVAELLATRGRARRDQVEQIMAGLPIGQGRTVLIASLFGGVGVSTLAVLLGQAWAVRGRHVDLVDATGSWAPGLPERSVPSPTLRLRTEPADAGAGPQDSIQASLRVIDSGSDPARLRRQLIEEPPQLLVMVCRPERTELQRTASFLRGAHQDGWLNCHQQAVVAAVGKIRRGVHADLSVIADIGSAIPIPHTRRLADRTRQITPADITPHVEALAAAAAIAPEPNTSAHRAEEGIRMTDTVLTAEILLAAPTPTKPPPATSAPAANGQIPPLNPDMNAPGMAGLLHTSDYLAAYVLWACVIAILIGALMVALGPRLGFHSAKSIGMGGVIGGVGLAAVVSLSTTAVNTSVKIFHGS